MWLIWAQMGKYPSIFLLSLLYGHCTLAYLAELFENSAFKKILIFPSLIWGDFPLEKLTWQLVQWRREPRIKMRRTWQGQLASHLHTLSSLTSTISPKALLDSGVCGESTSILIISRLAYKLFSNKQSLFVPHYALHQEHGIQFWSATLNEDMMRMRWSRES